MTAAAQFSESAHERATNGGGKIFESSMDVANSVLDLCREHLTPPTPKNYEVWHYYIDGDNAGLIECIDQTLEKSQAGMNEYELQQIHEQYVSKGQLGSDVIKTSHDMGEQLKAIQSILKNYASSSQSFGDTLTASLDELTPTSTVEQIAQSLHCILTENDRMQRETEELRSSVQRSQQQISSLEERLCEAMEVSQVDPLTQLYNRRHYDEQLPKAIVRAALEKSPLCLAVADIDHFKRINDTFGHQIGDGVLKMFADLLSKNVKGRDLVARYGGEEFVVVFEETSPKDAFSILEKIRVKLELTTLKVRKTSEMIGNITASFGLTNLEEGDDPDSLFERADALLYEAKQTGRNKIIFS